MVDINHQPLVPSAQSITRLFGRYRALVVSEKNENQHMRVKVFIPDFMEDIDKDWTWASAANNSLGGRNKDSSGSYEHDQFYGESHIPIRGTWVWIFFEAGNPNRPYYDGVVDIEQVEAPPENQVGKEDEWQEDSSTPNWYRKWVKHRSPEGRTIVISDDPYDERVEITGKKRKLLEKDLSFFERSQSDLKKHVYDTEDHQTIILLDERNGKEKLLIKDHKGNFINMYIEKEELHIEFNGAIHIHTDDEFRLKSEKDMHISTNGKMFIESRDDMNFFTKGSSYRFANKEIHDLSNGTHNMDALEYWGQSGKALTASQSRNPMTFGKREQDFDGGKPMQKEPQQEINDGGVKDGEQFDYINKIPFEKDTDSATVESIKNEFSISQDPSSPSEKITEEDDKIKTKFIPVKQNNSIEKQMERTNGDPGSLYEWEVDPSTPLPSGVSMGSDGYIVGILPEHYNGNVNIKLMKDGTKVDNQVYNLISNDGNGVILSNPMPDGKIGSRVFGKRMHPIDGYVKEHNGIDMTSGRKNANILSAADGTVVISRFSSSAGNYIEVDHGNGVRTQYMHLRDRKVGVGTKVSMGEVIGTEGSTGKSTGPHLHFGVRKKENGEWGYVDPQEYMDTGVPLKGES